LGLLVQYIHIWAFIIISYQKRKSIGFLFIYLFIFKGRGCWDEGQEKVRKKSEGGGEFSLLGCRGQKRRETIEKIPC
jgi:hypothetical protein